MWKTDDQTRPCGRCGCQERYHHPDKTYTSHKFRVSGIGSGQVFTIQITARTCCSKCPHCICFCTAFVEPFDGMPFPRCYYEAEDYTHDTKPDSTVQNPITVPDLVSSVQSRVYDDRGKPDSQPREAQLSEEQSSEVETRKPNKGRGGKGKPIKFKPAKPTSGRLF